MQLGRDSVGFSTLCGVWFIWVHIGTFMGGMDVSGKKVVLVLGGVLLLAFNGLASAGFGDTALHGFASQGYFHTTENVYLLGNSTEGSYAFSETGLNISAPVSDKLRIGVQLLGRDFGTDDNNVVLVDWAFGDYRLRDEFGLRIGKVKTSHGLYNTSRDIDIVRNSVLLPQSVYQEDYRSTLNAMQGLSLYGILDLGPACELEYEAFTGTTDLDRGDGLAKGIISGVIGGFPTTSYGDVVSDYYGGALRWNTPLEGFRLGYSALSLHGFGNATYAAVDLTTGAPAPFTSTMELDINQWVVLSAEYVRDNLTLSSEYARAFIDVDLLDIPIVHPQAGPMLIDIPITDRRGGYYGQAAYRFTDLLELGGYYSVYYPNFNDRDGDKSVAAGDEDWQAWQKTFALTARLDLADNWILKLETHFNSGTGFIGSSSEGSGLLGGPDELEENWKTYMAKCTFFF